MSDKAVLNFIDTVLLHFPPFRWEEDQEKGWVKTMIQELKGFADDVLNRAVSEMVRTRRDRKIPLVSECIHACLDARRWIEARDNAGKLPIEGKSESSHLDWTAERKKLAYDLIQGVMGKQAAKEGWIDALFSFIRRERRLPQPNEIASVKAAAKGLDDAHAFCVRKMSDDPDGKSNFRQLAFPARALEALGASMLRKRAELTDLVLHGVVKS